MKTKPTIKGLQADIKSLKLELDVKNAVIKNISERLFKLRRKNHKNNHWAKLRNKQVSQLINTVENMAGALNSNQDMPDINDIM